MKKCEKAVELFEAKAKKIVFKHTFSPAVRHEGYSYSRLFGFFGNFNLRLVKIEEELKQESWGIIMKYKASDEVDILNLLENLDERKEKARLDFIRNYPQIGC